MSSYLLPRWMLAIRYIDWQWFCRCVIVKIDYAECDTALVYAVFVQATYFYDLPKLWLKIWNSNDLVHLFVSICQLFNNL